MEEIKPDFNEDGVLRDFD